MPNILNHATQDEASRNLLTYKLLIDSGCSEKLSFFLCTLHFPLCDAQVVNSMPACRPMCEEVKAKCEPAMRGFGYSWPKSLNCSKLPVLTQKTLCIQQPKNLSSASAPPTVRPMYPRPFTTPHDQVNHNINQDPNPSFENSFEDTDSKNVEQVCHNNVDKYIYVKE